MKKHGDLNIQNELKSNNLKVLTPEPIPISNKYILPIKVTDVKSAKRLLCRVIKGYQSGEITDREAKTIAYLCQVMVQLIRDNEFEDRLKLLEEKVANK